MLEGSELDSSHFSAIENDKHVLIILSSEITELVGLYPC